MSKTRQKRTKESLITRKPQLASMIGTMLEYYDSSLYGFLVPFLTPIFLPNMDPINAIILGYAMYPIGLLTRPFGAILLGRLGDRAGRKKALIVCITGTAVATGCIGLIPPYAAIGIAAPLLLASLRLIQRFFVAGEYNGGAIFAIEHSLNKKGSASGIYCAFTATGTLAAAGMAAFVATLPHGFWRLAYILAFFTALYGIYIRKKAPETPEFEAASKKAPVQPFWANVKLYRWRILTCVGVAGCFSTLYCIPAIFMNGFIPEVTNITHAQILKINSLTMAIYIVFLIISGKLSDRFGYRKIMILTAGLTSLVAYPLFLLIETGSLFNIFLMKASFCILCGLYVGPMHAWFQNFFHVRARYQMISLSYSLGSQIGGITPALAMYLWKTTGMTTIPSLLIIAWSLIGVTALLLATPSKFKSPELEPTPLPLT